MESLSSAILHNNAKRTMTFTSAIATSSLKPKRRWKCNSSKYSCYKPSHVAIDGKYKKYADSGACFIDNRHTPCSPKISTNTSFGSVIKRRNLLHVLGFSVPNVSTTEGSPVTGSVASIQSGTGTLLTQLANSGYNSEDCARRLKELTEHLKKYPLARALSLQDSGLKVLLNIRENAIDVEVKRDARVALTLLGWSDPVKGKGLRILSIDGGGTRGVIAIEILKKIEELCNQEIHKMFDIIVGTSTGAVLGFLIGVKGVTLDDAQYLYYRLGEEIFTRNKVVGAGKLFLSHAFYDTDYFERILKQEVGDNITLIETAKMEDKPKVAAVSTLVNHVVLQPHVFRNYCIPPWRGNSYLGSSKYQLWEALRASSAAPGFFEEVKIGSDIHQDGGLLTNNPCALAVHEAKCLWPSTPIQTVVSIGTGLYHGRSGPHTSSFSSLRAKLMKVVASATDTEAVHTVMQDLMPPSTYFRFNPNLSVDIALDECRRDLMEQLQVDARNYIKKFDKKFKEASRSLKRSKTLLDKASESTQLYLDMYVR